MPAICNRIKQSAEGAILAVIEFVTKRGAELSEANISRYFAFIKQENAPLISSLIVYSYNRGRVIVF